MPKITYIDPSGKTTVVEESEGSLMEIAVAQGIEGIEGDCGGVGSCGTCHVRLAKEWLARVGPADEMEKDALSFESEVTEESRLSCQIEMSEELDGVVVQVVGQG